jgi:hypothetical protein
MCDCECVLSITCASPNIMFGAVLPSHNVNQKPKRLLQTGNHIMQPTCWS